MSSMLPRCTLASLPVAEVWPCKERLYSSHPALAALRDKRLTHNRQLSLPAIPAAVLGNRRVNL